MVDITFFEKLGPKIYENGNALAGWSPEQGRKYLQDPREALALFLKSYAYERAGGDPRRALMAERVVRESEKLDPETLWTEFQNAMGYRSLDAKRNPLAHNVPEPCVEKKRCVLCALRKDDGNYDNIVAKINRHLEKDEVITAHNFLKSIRGVGDKIAPFFLRDMAIAYGIFPKKFKVLLQPVDIWVRRIANFLITHQYDPKPITSDLAIATWIVEHPGANSPENANFGMWFFGAKIIGRRRANNIPKVLRDRATAEELLDQYVRTQTENKE